MVEESISQDWLRKTKENLLSFYKELDDLCREIGRSDQPRIVFATKYIDSKQLVSFIDLLLKLKIKDLNIGENRVQEAGEKFSFIEMNRPDLIKRFKKVMIGILQKNKINKALSIFDEIQAVDSLELAQAIDKRVKGKPFDPAQGKPIFLEINISREETKHGISPHRLNEVVKEIRLLRRLKLEGLITMAPFSDNPESARLFFRKLKQLADKFNLLTSMGMSHDWRIAVEEGSDVLRIGSRIFHR